MGMRSLPPTDEQLSRALRQAANRLDAYSELQRRENPFLAPSDFKITLWDWLPLIRKATTKKQLVAIMDALDLCFNEDESIMAGEDWRVVSHCISQKKFAMEESGRWSRRAEEATKK